MKDRLVFSTEHGAECQTCGRPLRKCRCSVPASETPTDGIIRISRQSKGRRGKTVVLISGVPQPELQSLCKSLKTTCGTGGTVQAADILIQGDQLEKIRLLLTEKGYKVK